MANTENANQTMGDLGLTDGVDDPVERTTIYSPGAGRAPTLDDDKGSGAAFAVWLRDEMVSQGLLSDGGARSVAVRGWSPPNLVDHTGFSLRQVGEHVEAMVFVDERAGLNQRRYIDDDGTELHEPVDPERIEPKIARILGDAGLEVRSVSYAGHQGLWDETVHYRAVFRDARNRSSGSKTKGGSR